MQGERRPPRVPDQVPVHVAGVSLEALPAVGVPFFGEVGQRPAPEESSQRSLLHWPYTEKSFQSSPAPDHDIALSLLLVRDFAGLHVARVGPLC